MNKKDLGLHIAGLLALGLTTTTQATLIDRGNGMIYDSDQDLTWLQDANYMKTSDYRSPVVDFDPASWTPWDGVMAWADGLVYGGYDDWRLPTITATQKSDVDTSTSELAYMFHVILGNESYYKPDGTYNQDGCTTIYDPDYKGGLFGDYKLSCLVNTGADGVEFQNIQVGSYATNTNAFDTDLDAWFFNTSWGGQTTITKSDPLFAWAVRDGDVGAPGASVPEPGTLVLMLAGLAGIGVTVRRRR
jgi:hypothetical protein